MIRASLLAFLILACDRAAPPRPDIDRWWLSSCGDVNPLQVVGAVTPPQLIERVEPRFEPIRNEGVIIVQMVVTAGGGVCAARVLKTVDTALDQAALGAVKRWRFRPALLNGTPRAGVYAATIRVTSSPAATSSSR